MTNILKKIIESINGNVQAQGFKIDFPAWMVMGSVEWQAASDKDRAYAYQAAEVTGWSDAALMKTVCNAYEFISEHTAKVTIDLLKELKIEYPLEIIDNKKESPEVTIRYQHGSKKL